MGKICVFACSVYSLSFIFSVRRVSGCKNPSSSVSDALLLSPQTHFGKMIFCAITQIKQMFYYKKAAGISCRLFSYERQLFFLFGNIFHNAANGFGCGESFG